MPPPCPSECIDMTPRQMWGAYWRASRDGRAEIPARLPVVLQNGAKGWFPFVKRCRAAYGGELPKFWKGYWGRVYGDRAQQGGSGATPHASAVQSSISDGFWEEYMERFPEGHGEDQGAQGGGGAADGWDGSKHGYVLISGCLCYKHPNGLTYEANGVDCFPQC